MSQVPVTVLTGYLGAGKTTLLNRILKEQHGRRYAVIINEYGEEGIDNDLVVDADEEIFETNNGCVCCTVRGDLIRILGGLMKRKDRFDGIIVETTGLADPAPVAQTFFMDQDVAEKTKLDAIVTVADAKFLGDRLGDSSEAREQIAFADIVLLNKTDLVEEAALAALEERIGGMNPYARIVRTERCGVALEEVLGRDAFSLERVLELEPHFLEHHHHHHHDSDIGSVSLSAELPLNRDRFMTWFRELLASQGGAILRSKGILDFAGETRRFVVHGVHMMMEGDFLGEWRPGEQHRSRLVLIGRDLDRAELEAGFKATVAS